MHETEPHLERVGGVAVWRFADGRRLPLLAGGDDGKPATLASAHELRAQIDAKQTRLEQIFKQAGEDIDLGKVTLLEGDVKAKAAAIRKLNDELSELGKQLHDPEVVPGFVFPPGKGRTTAMATPRAAGPWAEKASTREVATKALDPSGSVDMPAVLAPEVMEIGREVASVLALIPATQLRTGENFAYLRQTVRTNAAAAVAMAALKPTSVVSMELVEDRARTVATLSEPIPNQYLKDVGRLVDFLAGELQFMVLEEIEAQVLAGAAGGEGLTGILETTGTLAQAKGADPTPDAIFKAITKVRTGAAKVEPDAVVLHPNDWEAIALLRAADGEYLWGAPADATRSSIWGLPVILSTRMTENTGLVGAFGAGARLYWREGTTVDWSEGQTADGVTNLFATNQKVFRGEARVGFAVVRPAAFCEVTGI